MKLTSLQNHPNFLTIKSEIRFGTRMISHRIVIIRRFFLSLSRDFPWDIIVRSIAKRNFLICSKFSFRPRPGKKLRGDRNFKILIPLLSITL